MPTGSPNRSALTTIAEVAKSLAIAVLSLGLGVILCLCLILAGSALAAG